jgi:hypothetical protein
VVLARYTCTYLDIVSAFVSIKKTLTTSGRNVTFKAGAAATTAMPTRRATMHILMNEPLDGKEKPRARWRLSNEGDYRKRAPHRSGRGQRDTRERLGLHLRRSRAGEQPDHDARHARMLAQPALVRTADLARRALALVPRPTIRAIILKRNMLASSLDPTPQLSRRAFAGMVQDYLVLGNAYVQEVRNRLGQLLRLDHALAKFTRRGLEPGQFWWVPGFRNEVAFEPGTVHQIMAPDINQEIYGLPEYLSALQSACSTRTPPCSAAARERHRIACGVFSDRFELIRAGWSASGAGSGPYGSGRYFAS